ncbi:MAG: fused MFS/spermidine synthase [bacterium]
MRHLPLNAIVFISGASVLAIEILGTRILGPFYGVSLFLWSALITVTLVALSAGYWIGGRCADRGARIAHLGAFLAGAGVWLLLIPWIRRPLLAIAEPFGLRAAVLVAAFVLFAPPLTLLGMVSPFVIRIKTESVERVGRTAGDLFAISTLASVISALATGFWLIPTVGVARLTQMIGAFLLAGAAIAWLADRAERRARTSAAALIALLIAAAGLVLNTGHTFSSSRAGAGSVVVSQTESAYAEIRVIDDDEKRFLLIDGGIHTVVAPESWETYFAYVPVTNIVQLFFDEPGRMLLVGLGGGSIAKNFSASGWRVDAVEIDPAVARIAREQFGLERADATVYEADGRRFLDTNATRYDAVILDAFGSSSIPFHLVTEEAFALIASRLEPGGILAINIEAVGWRDPIVARFTSTLRRVFANVSALPTSEPPDALGNLILLASQRALEFPEDRLERPYAYLPEPYNHWCAVQKNHAWNNRFEPDTKGAQPFTDDLNSVDLLAERVNLAARRSLHASESLLGVSW